MAKISFNALTSRFDNIPTSLKIGRRWLVHRNKIPYQANNPRMQASVTNPETWATFEEAVDTYIRYALNPDPQQCFHGIGRVFVQEDGICGFDLDDIAKLEEHSLRARLPLQENLLSLATYSERSMNMKGWHVIVRGTMPVDGTREPSLGIEGYCNKRYFAYTGSIDFENCPNWVQEVTEQQEAIDGIWSVIGGPRNQSTDRKNLPHDSTECGRRLDLTDDDLFAAIQRDDSSGKFFRVFKGNEGNQPGRWSDSFDYLLTFLDQFSGNVGQVERIIMNSPFVCDSPPGERGELRVHKARRTLGSTWTDARSKNYRNYQNQIIGEERSRELLRSLQEKAEQVADELSDNATDLLRAFGINSRNLTYPPGIAGQFVKATEQAMRNPFLPFALPATLATIAGVVGRGYKLDEREGEGLNLNFVLAAPTASGKTQAMGAWEDFMAQANRHVTTSPFDHPNQSRIIKGGTASIQGIYSDFMDRPSAVWFVDEAAALLSQMSNPKSNIDHQLRGAYNELYDAGRANRVFAPPSSVANKKAGYEPIINLAISTFWTLPEVKFDMFTADVYDGFLSRVLILLHKGRAGERTPNPKQNLRRDLPQPLLQRLVDVIAMARRIDEGYARNPTLAVDEVRVVNTEYVTSDIEEVEMLIERIKNRAYAGDLPQFYIAVSRLSMNAKRVAGNLAVLENPQFPAITRDQYRWAVGFCALTLLSVMSGMDKGEIGEIASDDFVAIARAIKELMRKKQYKEGVPKTKLREVILNRKPFKTDTNKSERLTKAISQMEKDSLLFIDKQALGGPGRPAQLIKPFGDDDFWKKV